jgi:hypothetical protein
MMAGFRFQISGFRFLGGVACVFAVNSWLHADTLNLTDGNTMEGAILGRDAESIQIEVTRGGGKAQLEMPLDRIESIKFSRGLDEAVPGELKKLWLEREAFLEINGSDAGKIGLAYVKALLAEGDEQVARATLPIIGKIRDSSWNESDRTAAGQIRLTAMAAAGDVEQALAEARSLETMGAAETMDIAATRVRSRFVQAKAAWEAKLKLEQDWPKWHLMPEKRAQRRQLINEALDLFLFPVAHHAELTSLCAEGLMEAARIYRQIGKGSEARARAEEIIHYFPDPAYKEQASEFMNQQPEKKEPTDA